MLMLVVVVVGCGFVVGTGLDVFCMMRMDEGAGEWRMWNEPSRPTRIERRDG